MGTGSTMEFVSPDDHPGHGHLAADSTAGVIILGGGDLSPEWVQAAVPPSRSSCWITSCRARFAGSGEGQPRPRPALTNYMLEVGHRRIGFIRGASKYWTLSERLAGFMLALQQAGISPEESGAAPRVSHSGEKGYGEMQILLDLPDPPTAVVAVSNKAAVGAYGP